MYTLHAVQVCSTTTHSMWFLSVFMVKWYGVGLLQIQLMLHVAVCMLTLVGLDIQAHWCL